MKETLIKHCYGWKPSPPDQRDHIFAAQPRVVAALPPMVDLDATPIPIFDPCWDQSALGSCGPNSLCENIVYDIKTDPTLAAKMKMMPSRLFSYYVTRMLMGTVNQDSGVDNRTMLKAAAQFGWCDASLWPYNIKNFAKQPPRAAFVAAQNRKISQYLSVPQDLQTMKACLAGNSQFGIKGRPFIFGFTVYESFESQQVATTGIVPLPGPNESVLGGHDITVVGYNDATQMFKMKNHWNPNWGYHGYCFMPYAYAINPKLSGDFWTVITSPF